VHKWSSLLISGTCSLRGCHWLCPASIGFSLKALGWQGCSRCTFHLQPQLHLRIKAIIRSAESVHTNTEASSKRACVCSACHYPGDAFSPSILTFASCSRAPAAKWAQKQPPVHGRGVGSGANSDGCRLPSFPDNKRPGQSDTLL